MTSMVFLVAATACQNRVYLSDREKLWNPYRVGQKLVFHSTGDRYDTLEIIQVDNSAFSDGIGARGNERLKVVTQHRVKDSNRLHELLFLYITAPWKEDPSAIDFNFFLPDRSFMGRNYSIAELEGHKEIVLETPQGTFHDVIAIEDNSHPFKKQGIKVVFWSKSAGYVRFEQYDGTVGELVDLMK